MPTQTERQILAYCSTHADVSVDDIARALPCIDRHTVNETVVSLIKRRFVRGRLNVVRMLDGTISVPGRVSGLTHAGRTYANAKRRVGF